ncbi:peptide chain release factor 1-like, mitochondrial [Onthophagus taurus]|uniref:peptide chain release factor 1-like, mitochondrial n=1 Tax=Onthophagus taurus TaxID=166361 RepID=UPI0039BDECFB
MIIKHLLTKFINNRYIFKYQKCLTNYHIFRTYSNPPYELNLNINGVSLNKYLSNLVREYEKLDQTTPTKRLIEIQPVISLLNNREELVKDMHQLGDLLNESDKGLKELALEEKKVIEDKIASLDKELEEVVLHLGDEQECNSIIVEVNAGVGGQEAMLFAKELFEMYCGYTNFKGWSYDVVEYSTTDLGGIRHAIIFIDGENCFRFFKYEAGVHRVQRIPTTEKAGRVHTSTASVLATPQPTDIQVNLQSKDLIIETKRASGAGGQHVNTTDSAVRVTHVPSGISIECQVDRSQLKNKNVALQRLKAKLYEMELEKQQSDIASAKKNQVKSNFRNEKIRTYNYPQDRITDHRLQSSNVHNLKYFLEGNELLDNLINKLYINDKVDQLLNSIDNK